MMQHPDSFVKDCTTVAPEKEGDSLNFRVFMKDTDRVAFWVSDGELALVLG